MNPQLLKLLELLKNDEYVKSTDFVDAFVVLADVVDTLKEKYTNMHSEAVDELANAVRTLRENFEKKMNDKVSPLVSTKDLIEYQQTVKEELEKIRDSINTIELTPGEKGDTPEITEELKEEIAESALALLKKENPIPTPQEWIKMINALPTDKDEFKIDIKHIKGMMPQMFVPQPMPSGGFGAPIETVIKAGANITVTKDASGAWVIASTGGGGGGGTWGSITGTLSNQTDLQSALDLKANLASPTFTGTVTLPSDTSIGNVSATEIGYLDGVTSAIQTQLNAKIASIADPNADRLFGWDDTDGAYKFITIGSNLSYDHATHTLSASGSGGTPTVITVADEAADTSCYVAFFTAATGDLGPKTNAGLTFNSATGMLTATGFTGPLTGNASTATVLANARTIGGVSFNGSANIVPGTITVADGGGDTTMFVGLWTDATGDLAPKTDAGLTYNATTNALTATTFIGALTGNASTASAVAIGGITGLGTGVATALAVNVGSAGAFITFNGDAGTPSALVGTNITGTASGLTAGVATLANTVASSNEAGDTTCFILFQTASGTTTLATKNNTGLTYNASTNAVGATTFVGALTGNASTATALATPRTIGGVSFDGTANIVPATITIANEATDTSCFLLFTTAATGDLGPKSNTALTYNSNTGALGSTSFVGALTGNASTATALATARAIYGNNFDGTAALTQVIASTYGGTGNGFTKFSGPGTSEKTFTLPNASAVILTDNAAVTVAQGGTGVASLTAYAVLCGGTTSTGAVQALASVGTAGHVLTSNGAGALPSFQAPAGGGDVYALTAKPTTYWAHILQWHNNGTTSGDSSGTNFGYQWWSNLNASLCFVQGHWGYYTTSGSDGGISQRVCQFIPGGAGAWGFNSGKKLVASWWISTSSTGTIGWGLSGNSSAASFTATSASYERVYFKYTGGNTMNCVTDNSSSQTQTSVTCPTMSNAHLFRIEFDSTSLVRFYIDGTLVATHTTNIPSGGSGVHLGFGIATSGQICNISEANVAVEI